MTNREKFVETFHRELHTLVPVYTAETVAWLESTYDIVNDDEIQHVGYDKAACGYEK